MQYSARILPSQYCDVVDKLECISDFWAYIESGVMIAGLDHFRLAREAKAAAMTIGVSETIRHNALNDPQPGINWIKGGGFTATMLHTIFDEMPTYLSRYL